MYVYIMFVGPHNWHCVFLICMQPPLNATYFPKKECTKTVSKGFYFFWFDLGKVIIKIKILYIYSKKENFYRGKCWRKLGFSQKVKIILCSTKETALSLLRLSCLWIRSYYPYTLFCNVQQYNQLLIILLHY